LCARRALTKLGLADKYEGVTEPDGTLKLTEVLDEEDAPRPFKCYLDVGLKRTSTGSRLFGAMKGASDGGIFIPHSDKRFPGYDPESKELDAEVLKKYIFGGHVAEYMESLEEEDDERYAILLLLADFSGFNGTSASRNNSQLILLMVSAPKTLRRSTPMLTPQSVKTPLSSPPKNQKTGKPSHSNSLPRDSLTPSARPTSQPKSRSSRLVATMRMRMRRTEFVHLLFIHDFRVVYMSIVCNTTLCICHSSDSIKYVNTGKIPLLYPESM